MSNKPKVGDRVVNSDTRSAHFSATGTVVDVTNNGECISVRRDDGTTGSGLRGAWTARASSWSLLPEQSVPPIQIPEDWSYAEADRLYDAAVLAVEAYNNYIERKPTTTYGKAYTPAKYF